MKIILSVLFILFLCVIPLFAQNFIVTVEDTVGEDIPGNEIALGGHIINFTSRPLTVNIVRETNDIPPNWTSSLCLELCVAPWVDSIAGTVPPNDSIEFSIHFFTDSDPGEGSARLVITELRSGDSFSYLFIAKTSAIDVAFNNDANSYSFKLLGNYPNPFNNSTIIRFQAAERIQTAELLIFSITGQLIFKKSLYNLPLGENQISYHGLDLFGNELPSGIYVYQLLLISASGIQFSDIGKFTLLK